MGDDVIGMRDEVAEIAADAEVTALGSQRRRSPDPGTQSSTDAATARIICQSDQIGQRQRPDGVGCAADHADVDVLGGGDSASSIRIADRMNGTNSAFTTNPARSWQRIACLCSVWSMKIVARSAVSVEVSRLGATSTSDSTGTGLKKCRPTTRSGRPVAAAKVMIGNDDVFDAALVGSRKDLVESAEQRPLRVEVLDDGLDRDLPIGQLGEVLGEPGPPPRTAAASGILPLPSARINDAPTGVVTLPGFQFVDSAGRGHSIQWRPRSRASGRRQRKELP